MSTIRDRKYLSKGFSLAVGSAVSNHSRGNQTFQMTKTQSHVTKMMKQFGHMILQRLNFELSNVSLRLKFLVAMLTV